MTLLRSDPITGTSGVAVNTFTNQTGSGTFLYQGSSALAKMTPVSSAYSPTNFSSNVADAADVDVYIDVMTPDNLEGYHTLAVRGQQNNTNYNVYGVSLQFQPGAGQYEVEYIGPDGSNTVLGYPQWEDTPNIVYTARFRVVGTSVQTKVWRKSAAEPSVWDASYTLASSVANTYITLGTINGGGGQSSFYWGNLYVYDAAGKPVVQVPVSSSMANFFSQVPIGPQPDTVSMPSGVLTTNGHTWSPIIDEDFTSTPNTTNVMTAYPNMGYYNGFTDTSGQGWYDPTQVLSVVNGVLTANMKTAVPSSSAQAAGAPSTAKPLVACVMPDNYEAVVYGRASIRFRANATVVGNGTGYKFVWFYFPIDNNWNEGEIDSFESDITSTGRSRPANAIPGTGVDANGNPVVNGNPVYGMTFSPGYNLYMPTTFTDWHVATVEWAPEAIYIYWDNVLIGTIDNTTSASKPWVPTNVFDFKLQMETVINEGTIDPTAQAKVEIDRVQTWELVGYGAGGYGFNGYGL